MSMCRVVLQVDGEASGVDQQVRMMIAELTASGAVVRAASLTVDLGGQYDLLAEPQPVKEGGVIVDGQVVYPA